MYHLMNLSLDNRSAWLLPNHMAWQSDDRLHGVFTLLLFIAVIAQERRLLPSVMLAVKHPQVRMRRKKGCSGVTPASGVSCATAPQHPQRLHGVQPSKPPATINSKMPRALKQRHDRKQHVLAGCNSAVSSHTCVPHKGCSRQPPCMRTRA